MSADNPWATSAESTPSSTPATGTASEAPATNPWSGESASPSAPTDTADWLTASPAPTDSTTFDWVHPFQETLIPLNTWVDQGLDWLVNNFRPVFQAIRWPID
ncbi:MAG: proline/betaine ABC transporter permease ProW, partial [Candidatus Competibacteraceae bacterium]|nr:proline/betaine ABC transporter permease ProW [Candidatus Competibacteraceae bacterium]